MARRTAAQITSDRDALVRSFSYDGWTRPAEGTPRSDIDALEKAGLIETEVRREWDKGTGHQHAFFGGAAVMQRHRLYVRRVRVATPAPAPVPTIGSTPSTMIAQGWVAEAIRRDQARVARNIAKIPADFVAAHDGDVFYSYWLKLVAKWVRQEGGEAHDYLRDSGYWWTEDGELACDYDLYVEGVSPREAAYDLVDAYNAEEESA